MKQIQNVLKSLCQKRDLKYFKVQLLRKMLVSKLNRYLSLNANKKKTLVVYV